MAHPPTADRPATMHDYGVPADEEGLLDWAWAAERLERSRNYWVTTVSADGSPHSMPVWGVWIDARPGFYFSCARSAFKVRNLARNPQVVVCADSTVEVVSLEGVAEVPGEDELTEVIDAWITKYAAELGQAVDDTSPEEMASFLRENAAFAVRPAKAFGVIETPEDFGPRATRWRWDDRTKP